MNIPFIFLVLVLLVAACASKKHHPLSEDYIAEINRKSKTWTAGKNFEIGELDRVKRIASGVIRGYPEPTNLLKNPHNEDEKVPEYFDAREQWPDCESIKEIRDQGNCGSCWAFGAVESMSDRICIHSNQTKQTRVSAEHLNNCCAYCNFGCSGGFPMFAWDYWYEFGIVTGGKYQSNQGCQDYTLEPCNHHVENQVYPTCNDTQMKVTTPDCIKDVCTSKSSLVFKTELTFGLNYTKFTNEKQIMLEVYKNEPIEVDFFVYEDFLNYKSGVYQNTTGKTVGSHAVKLLGWGVENDTKYWLIANSWNEYWGDKGFFKIIRGVNSCGIESDGLAALPIFSDGY